MATGSATVSLGGLIFWIVLQAAELASAFGTTKRYALVTIVLLVVFGRSASKPEGMFLTGQGSVTEPHSVDVDVVAIESGKRHRDAAVSPARSRARPPAHVVTWRGCTILALAVYGSIISEMIVPQFYGLIIERGYFFNMLLTLGRDKFGARGA